MMLTSDQQNQLLTIARRSIEQSLSKSNAVTLEQCLQQVLSDDVPGIFQAQHPSFVTLKKNAALRGCIGNLEANSSLVESIYRNAKSAAFHDPRFPAVNLAELEEILISISILTPKQAFPFSNEDDLKAKLEPGKDGLVIQTGQKRATFLPAVWESLPDVTSFIDQLKQKAGMSENEEIEKAWRYQAISFSETG